MIAGGYEHEPKPWGLNGVPQDWNFKLLEPDWDRFTPLMENIIKRVPSMESVEIVQLLNGPEGFTPDSEYLLGPTAVRGFWVACAFCAHGIAGAGGIGKVMAEWIIDGHPEWDIWKLDARRFRINALNCSSCQDRPLGSRVENEGDRMFVSRHGYDRQAAHRRDGG